MRKRRSVLFAGLFACCFSITESRADECSDKVAACHAFWDGKESGACKSASDCGVYYLCGPTETPVVLTKPGAPDSLRNEGMSHSMGIAHACQEKLKAVNAQAEAGTLPERVDPPVACESGKCVVRK